MILYRFHLAEVRRLLPLLRLDAFEWRNRYSASAEMAVAILLTRLASPERLRRANDHFGRSPSFLSTVFNDTVDYLIGAFGGLLEWHPRLDDYGRLEEFAVAIAQRADLPKAAIWGFVDGTFRPFCRPSQEQRAYYSGHKKAHGMKFQAIATPDGLVSSLHGPWLGPDNDWRILLQSGVQDRMEKVSSLPSSPAAHDITKGIYVGLRWL